ncbi:MAG: DUF4250 domain-containing protein [Gammaproteobacteria bacterium]|nr:DUF4250 domain-containing protein [Gammaproteobacteria bacterium]
MTGLKDYRTMDPAMLYSLVNTRLRNDYRDLDDLVRALRLDRGELEGHLAAHGFHFDAALKQFR